MLLHDLQPILAYTTDEVMAYLPESLREGQQFAALLDWYKAPWDRATYERYLPTYNAIVEARAVYTKAYEEALEAGTVTEKTTQATRVTLAAAPELYELLTGDVACDLSEHFVCAEVEVTSADETSATVEPAHGERCERCWYWRETDEEGLCPRCHDAIH